MGIEVSIIIPLYNKEDFIERALACIEHQTFVNWECIIIDDGSTDLSAKIVQNYISDRGHRWKYVFQENMGQAAARNAGINQSNGKYLAFLDADDLWPNYKLSSQFAELESNPSCVLVLSPFVIFDQHSLFPRLIKHTNTEKMLSGWLSMRGFGGGIESVGLIRRSVLGTQMRFDESLTTSSGLDLTLRLSDLGEIILLKKIGLVYRINDGQWHTNMFEWARNMSIIRDKHEVRSALSLELYHLAYLFWAEKRLSGWRYFFGAIFRSAFDLKNRRFLMIACLVLRNLKAKALGFLYYKRISNLIKNLD